MNNSDTGKTEPFFAGVEPAETQHHLGDAAGTVSHDGGANPGGPDPADSATEVAQLTGEIAQLKAQLQEAGERVLRSAAEMENVRRRAADDVSKAHKFSIESFAESLIPVVDSLEMALKVENPTVESLREGTEATLRQLMASFEKNKLTVIDPAGEKFDPNCHQAISMVPAAALNPPVPANHVASVLQKGYLINDRVLRPAMVTGVQA